MSTVARMTPFTISLYVRRADALAQNFPVWGRLRVSIPYDRFQKMTPEENFGVYQILEDQLSWNRGELLQENGQLGKKPDHLGIKESDFPDNDIRCALRIEKVEPWLRDAVLDGEVDEYGRVKLSRAGMIVVLENMLRIAAQMSKAMTLDAKNFEREQVQDDDENRIAAVKLIHDRAEVLASIYRDALGVVNERRAEVSKSLELFKEAQASQDTERLDRARVELVYAQSEFKRAMTLAGEAFDRYEIAQKASNRQHEIAAMASSKPAQAPADRAVASEAVAQESTEPSTAFVAASPEAPAVPPEMANPWIVEEPALEPQTSAKIDPFEQPPPPPAPDDTLWRNPLLEEAHVRRAARQVIAAKPEDKSLVDDIDTLLKADPTVRPKRIERPALVQVGTITQPPRHLREFAPELLKDSKIVQPKR